MSHIPSQPPNGLRTVLQGQSAKLGLIAGVAYGIAARYAAEAKLFGDGFVVMSLAFLVLVPVVLGFLTVSSAAAPSLAYRIFAPWVPALFVVLAATAIGWEGAICVLLGLPMILLFASIGGAFGGLAEARRTGVRPVILVLPLLGGSIERHVDAPVRFTETSTQIAIDAPPAVVWPLIASVDSIRPEEQHPALFTRLGFPRPISATISGAGVGAIRRARFERGLVFTETVTDWKPERRLAFTIRPNTDAIPATTLDRHVTIGGPFFDVLTGTYELTPTRDGRGTLLLLRSQHRVSTRFNLYAGWWADQIMGSIQRNILAVHKARAEPANVRAVRPPSMSRQRPAPAPLIVPAHKVQGPRPTRGWSVSAFLARPWHKHMEGTYAVEAKQVDRCAGGGGMGGVRRRLVVGRPIGRGRRAPDAQSESLGARAPRRPEWNDCRQVWSRRGTSVASDADRRLSHRRHRMESELDSATSRLGGEKEVSATGRRGESHASREDLLPGAVLLHSRHQ